MEVSGVELVIWHNGRLLPESTPAIQTTDQGFLCGHGLYETILIANGKPFALDLHLARLKASARLIGTTPPANSMLSQAVSEVIKANHFVRARIRITISIDAGPLFINSTGTLSNIVVSGQFVSDTLSEPAQLITVPFLRNDQSPLTGVKSISYSENIVAYRFARERGGSEALFYNTRNELCEGSRSNVFVVINDKIVTPPRTSGCLPGVTRKLILDLAHEARIPVEEAPLTSDALNEATEIFITSSIRGVQEVNVLDNRTFTNTPGLMTHRIQQIYEDLLAKETR